MAKTKGCKAEYGKERVNALMKAYRAHVSDKSHIYLPAVCAAIVQQPCRRFWVSPLRASIVVSNIIKGDDLSSMSANKREMYREIYCRYCELIVHNPGMSLYRAVATVVEQPAPKFYLTPGSAKIMISKARKEWRKKQSRK